MERPTKILACGALIAGAIIGVNAFDAAGHERRVEVLQRRLDEMHSRCIAEGEAGKASDKWWASSSTLVCDPNELKAAMSTTDLVGIQKELATDEKNLSMEMDGQPREWPYALATFIFGFCAIPWIWYFILRRIRELGDAVRGR